MPRVAPARIVLLIAALLCAAFTAGYAAPLHALGSHPVPESTSAPCPHLAEGPAGGDNAHHLPIEVPSQPHDALACAGACCGICFNAGVIGDGEAARPAGPTHVGRTQGAVAPLPPDGDDPPPRLAA